MKNINWLQKLSSRKFWAAFAGVVISIMVAFGAEAEQQEKIAGIITACSTIAIYMLAEGAADKAAIGSKESDKKGGAIND